MTDAFRVQAEKAQQKWEDIEGLKQQAERQRQDVAKAEAALAKAKADLDALPGMEESEGQNAGEADTARAELRDLAAQVLLISSPCMFQPDLAWRTQDGISLACMWYIGLLWGKPTACKRSA